MFLYNICFSILQLSQSSGPDTSINIDQKWSILIFSTQAITVIFFAGSGVNDTGNQQDNSELDLCHKLQF